VQDLRILALSFCICTIVGNPVFSQVIPAGRPDTEISYNYLRELYLRGDLSPSVFLFAPIDYDQIESLSSDPISTASARLITPLERLNRHYEMQPKSLAFHAALAPHVEFNDMRQKAYFAIIPELNYRISKRWSADLAYRVDGALVDDQLYQGKRWGGAAGYAELAILSYRHHGLAIDLGRRRTCWGIARDGWTLMHSSFAMPLDGIFIEFRPDSHLALISTAAYLAPIADNSPLLPAGQSENRYFSAHALRISPFEWWDVLLKESVIYGGIGRRLEAAYLAPFLWFHAEQLNADADDNTFLGFETVVRARDRFAGYLELLLDDIQIESETEGDSEPAEFGLIAGFDIFDIPLPMGSWELEYVRIANRTYSQLFPRNVYINQGYAIGQPLGPDHQSLSLSFTYHFTPELSGRLEFYARDRGEGRIGDRWTAPWLDQPDFHENFPSGVVEKSRGIKTRFFFNKNGFLQGKLLADIADIKNIENISGADKKVWNIEIVIIVNLPNLNWRLNDGQQ